MKNNYRHRFALAVTFALLTYTSPIFSQNLPPKTISGTITDADGPLNGVNVLVKNTARGSVSDLEGRYALLANSSDTLVFTYLGYKTQEVAVGSRRILNVNMQADATALDQVVINAGYYKVSDKEKTGSIARVTAKVIEDQPVTNPLAAMQGRLAGVNIVQNTGLPGGGFSVRIRGRNSIRTEGSEPLYIVDGVPYPSQSLGNYIVSTVLGPVAQSPLNGINPGDIESIEVLKDADATAIYGSRGANGVVLITTKKGKVGKTSFSLKTSSGVGKIQRRMQLLNTEDYLATRREAFANDGIAEYPYFEYDINGTWSQDRYTDWQKELLGNTAYYTSASAAVQGGSSHTHYLLRGDYGEQTTVLPGDYTYKKGSVLVNLNHKPVEDKFSIQFSGNYTFDNNDLPASNLLRESLILPPNAPTLYGEDGELNWEDGTFNNPLAVLNAEYRSKANYLRANSVISYKPLKNLVIKANLGYYSNRLEETRTTPNTVYNPVFGLDSRYSSLIMNSGEQQSYIIEPQAIYSKEWGRGLFELLIGATIQNDVTDRFLVYASDFPSNQLIYDLAAAGNIMVQTDAEERYKYRAVFGRVNVNWDHKYIINLTARRDGSSRFGPGNQYANFGAVGMAYLFSEERFIKNTLPFFSHGKIRASYGTTGNDQIGNYGYLDVYATNGLSYQNTQSLQPVQLYNPNFGWETNRKLEVALELGFLKDRLFFTASYYRNRSGNQLVGVPLPGTTGFSSIQANLDATVENTGLEFELATTNIRSTNFRWNTTFNLTIPKNKLVSFPNLDVSTYANQYVIEEPLDVLLLYQFNGVDPQTGLYSYTDVDGDGLISSPNDRIASRNIGPKYYGGLANSISYKNFNLDFLFQFVKQQARNYLASGPFPGTMANQPTAILDHWQQEGDTAPVQMFSAGYNNEAYLAYVNYYNSTASVTDASYIRLKNVALSYKVPNPFATHMDCRLFLQGQNLITFTDFLGPDPETSINGDLPPLKLVTVGLEFKL